MVIILLSIFFPILCGVCLLVGKEFQNRKHLLVTVGIMLVLSAGLSAAALCMEYGGSHTLFYLMKNYSVGFQIDAAGAWFVGMADIIFLCAGFFSFEYMKHERKEKRYYGFYLLVMGVFTALCFAGNLITFYLFFEILTLVSMPLVLHNGSHEAVIAGLKYLFYSLCGAYMALFGIYYLSSRFGELGFAPGGLSWSLLMSVAPSGIEGFGLVALFLMLLGFGVKAGMFPMHAWLPTAHPVAPAPASAVLSAVIVKAGVLAVLRVVYYTVGPGLLRGTWVQTAWMTLTLITVFMGSLLAYRENVLKKRLAYSTVSQISYILFGFSVMNGTSVNGSMLHVLSHGFVKAALFLCAGAIIYKTGRTRVSELRGIGKEMPVLLWCYTICSLGLIGIPPTGGFLSKWYLAVGSLSGGLAVFSWLGPVVLLVSALLTAGYLLPVTIKGFFPGEDYDYKALEKKEPSMWMNLPVLLLTVLAVVMGLFPDVLLKFLSGAGIGTIYMLY